ncbi:MAG: hypothetical protein IT437_00135 [Phycisphaerales bacterium]|nr:hypothetical protein [Phycisphaerales bacterium]
MRPLFFIVPLAAVAGCVTEGGPRDPGPQPRGATPQSLSLIAPNFVDTDENQYRDSTSLVVYLFAGGYAVPVTAEGSFEFRLMDRKGKSAIASWEFSAAEAAGAVRRLGPGPGYVFTLNLQDKGGDKLEMRDAKLVCTFRPTTGDALRTESSPLLVGMSHVDAGSR